MQGSSVVKFIIALDTSNTMSLFAISGSEIRYKIEINSKYSFLEPISFTYRSYTGTYSTCYAIYFCTSVTDEKISIN